MGSSLSPIEIPPSSCCNGGKTEEHSYSSGVCAPAKPLISQEEPSKRAHGEDKGKNADKGEAKRSHGEVRPSAMNSSGDATAEEAAWLRVSFIEFVARASSASGYKLDAVLPGGQSCQIILRLSEDLSTLRLQGHSEFAAMIMSRGQLVTDSGAHNGSLSVTIPVANLQSARSLGSAADNPQFLGSEKDAALADAILRLGRNRVVEVRHTLSESARGLAGVLHLVDRDENEAELLATMLTLLRLHGRHEAGLPGSERSVFSAN
eukprot:gnl/MRDRNA2_/MRDRNA2_98419_c0_seq1.p1 gnl/MRDRNA2_/MRDRNA2_98419_c0~~gnl/MRDRNA2_/MRDRNA2_98419_c0_seq1.p1  ORF type:complete len:263 (-),score=50.89 gnl/MRDRNA2_/MRDRNA2_98419_c0_seq1:75-863(-)